ncbi:hypothetical protein SVIO_093150 [Streptomyces violaceusniger]|uniref:Uncharacterized protein n=1 Tax=Streptomyces violaceusniger TaxID=68280 RepID=A0A4D4LBS0_STRVO|nr:hypothetical protein SVIO_093150 [Streptomyces violaceusniger]
MASRSGCDRYGSSRTTGSQPKWATATRRLNTAAPAETLSARPNGSAYRGARSGAARTSRETVSGFSR